MAGQLIKQTLELISLAQYGLQFMRTSQTPRHAAALRTMVW